MTVLALLNNNAIGKSLLQPQSFPNTFNDLSFTERVEVLSAGYEPWQSEYDANGRCISGCPYAGITIEDHLAMMERQTQLAVSQLQQAGLLNAPTRITQKPTQIVPTNMHAQTSTTCTPRHTQINSANTVPLDEPLMGRPKITSPFGDRIHPIKKQREPHSGIDISVPIGTDVFTPASGTVSAVWTDRSCGRGIRIAHSDGYETVYCHLNEQLVANGDKVQAGCRIAKTGNTGASTGPHLHYGVKLNGVYINPIKLMGRD